MIFISHKAENCQFEEISAGLKAVARVSA